MGYFIIYYLRRFHFPKISAVISMDSFAFICWKMMVYFVNNSTNSVKENK